MMPDLLVIDKAENWSWTIQIYPTRGVDSTGEGRDRNTMAEGRGKSADSGD
jgi:hypothetical protein